MVRKGLCLIYIFMSSLHSVFPVWFFKHEDIYFHSGSTLNRISVLLEVLSHTAWKVCVQIRSFFWSIFSCIRTEFGGLLRKSLYSVRIQENTDQKKLRIWTPFTQCYFSYSWKFPCLYFYINIAIENLSKIKSRVNYIYTAPY